MGCVCGKASSAVKDSEYSPKQRELRRKTSELLAARAVSARRDVNGSFSMKEKYENGERRVGLVDKKGTMSRRVRDDFQENRNEGCEVVSNFPSMRSVPKALQGEQVAAGWPNWLVSVAGEAINGWVPRKADTYEKLNKIGQGTYSSVYKGRDILNNRPVALKKVRFDNMDPESVKFMAREILILRRLDHPNVIKLEALVTSRTSSSLYLVFEYMEHDLTGIASLPGVKFTEPQVKCYMQQLLSGLDYCHSNGVLHRDIKGSNLLVDNQGVLKIADFGLASYFDNRQSVPLTSRVVTLWYRPPELLLGATNYGVAVDLWSSGCILGELYTGKPIMPGRTEVEQLHKIFKLCGSPSEEYWRKTKLPHSTVFKPTQPYRKRIAETLRDLPYAAIELMETLLSVDPSDRGTASSALNNEFFSSEPLPCDPSSLPKYPPSKEIDAKLRDEEARRQGLSGVKGQKVENNLKRKESRAAPAPHANAELASSMQRRQDHPGAKSKSEYFNPQKEEPCTDFPVNPPRYSQASKGTNRNSSPKNGLSSLSGLVTSRVFSSVEARDKSDLAQVEATTTQECRLSESFGDPIRNPGQGRRTHSQVFRGTQQLEHGRSSTKEPVIDGHGHREKRIHFSGPLVAPSNNIEQILKEHDRRIQEVARRLRHEKGRGGGRARPSQEPHVKSYSSSQRVG